MAEGPQQQRVLARAIDAILESYAEHGNINHMDGENLPSRAEISALLDDLVAILFPGYFTREQLDDLTARWLVGERCARVLRGLERVIGRALCDSPETGADGQPCSNATINRRAHDLSIELISRIPSIRAVLDTDVQAALAGDPAARSPAEVIMSYPGVLAIAVHRVAHQLYTFGVPLLPRMMAELIHGRTGIDIHPGATIGERFFIDHGTGLVIGETTVIGTSVKLYQGVTLGALSVSTSERQRDKQRHPTIEDGVTIYAGATILGGDTRIGAGSTIGGNVWLTHSVPQQTTVLLDNPSLRFIHRGRAEAADG
ncbi:MAG: serine acetyltransferase [Nannocystaceae bacterium]|nr:serine acetyltransferase [Nannocystaceae bacterium]